MSLESGAWKSGGDSTSKVSDPEEPLFDLARVLEFAAWHRRVLLSVGVLDAPVSKHPSGSINRPSGLPQSPTLPIGPRAGGPPNTARAVAAPGTADRRTSR